MDAVDLFCSFDGQPPPNISWYFIGYQHNSNRPQLLSSGSGIGDSTTSQSGPHYLVTGRHLRIQQATIDDIGTYVCVANNSNFEVRHETDFIIRNYLQLNVSTDRANQSPLLPGDTITLSCNLTDLFRYPVSGDVDVHPITDDGNSNYHNKRPPPSTKTSSAHKLIEQVLNSRFIITYHWYHNLVPISTQDAINYVNKRANNNRKPYSSSVVNSNVNSNNNPNNNNQNNNHLRRNYHSPPQSATLFYSSSSTSSATSSAAASASLTSSTSAPQYELVEQNVLRIHNIDYPDTGIYQCFVKLTGPDYEEWLQSHTVVQMKHEPPKLVSTFNEQILISNNELSLQCTAQGIPAPIIIWQRNGINLTDFMGNLITSHQHHKHHQAAIGGLYRYKAAMFQSAVSSTTTSSASANSYYNNGNNDKPDTFQTISYFNITTIRSQVCARMRIK